MIQSLYWTSHEPPFILQVLRHGHEQLEGVQDVRAGRRHARLACAGAARHRQVLVGAQGGALLTCQLAFWITTGTLSSVSIEEPKQHELFG